jgi:hypothetical protein
MEVVVLNCRVTETNEGILEKRSPPMGDRGFESISLQRGVLCELRKDIGDRLKAVLAAEKSSVISGRYKGVSGLRFLKQSTET